MFGGPLCESSLMPETSAIRRFLFILTGALDALSGTDTTLKVRPVSRFYSGKTGMLLFCRAESGRPVCVLIEFVSCSTSTGERDGARSEETERCEGDRMEGEEASGEEVSGEEASGEEVSGFRSSLSGGRQRLADLRRRRPTTLRRNSPDLFPPARVNDRSGVA